MGTGGRGGGGMCAGIVGIWLIIGSGGGGIGNWKGLRSGGKLGVGGDLLHIGSMVVAH